MNEIISPYHWGPTIFGIQGPDTGNAEIIAHYGTPEQRAKYLQPLLDGELFSAFSMTEPHGGSDPLGFTCAAVQDGTDWVINGQKFFTSNSEEAAFLIVIAVTDPDAEPYRRMSMFLVPRDTPGIEMTRRTQYMNEAPEAMDHALLTYNNVRVPADGLLGEPGQGFEIAQTRLSGGRIHHAMRAIGQAQYALDMACERVLSRTLRGRVARPISSSCSSRSPRATRRSSSSGCSCCGRPGVSTKARATRTRCVATSPWRRCSRPRSPTTSPAGRCTCTGRLGLSNEMPFGAMWSLAPGYAIWDGPTESHLARRPD